MQNSHVILIIVMATHCLVCGSRDRACNNIILLTLRPHLRRWCAVTWKITCREPDWRARNQNCTSSSPRNRSRPSFPAQCRARVGSGTETSVLRAISWAWWRGSSDFWRANQIHGMWFFMWQRTSGANEATVFLHARPAYQTMRCHDNN